MSFDHLCFTCGLYFNLEQIAIPEDWEGIPHVEVPACLECVQKAIKKVQEIERRIDESRDRDMWDELEKMEREDSERVRGME